MIVKPAVLALRRRSLAEQRTVRLLRTLACGRSGALDAEIAKLGLTPIAARRFGQLVKLALGMGYSFQSPASPFVSLEELRLVGLIAQAQRINVDHREPVSGEFRDSLIACAVTLDAAGVRLPPLAMVSAQLPDPAQSRLRASH